MYGLTLLKLAMLAEALRSISGVRRPSAGADAACRRVAKEARKAGTLADACIGELRPQGLDEPTLRPQGQSLHFGFVAFFWLDESLPSSVYYLAAG